MPYLPENEHLAKYQVEPQIRFFFPDTAPVPACPISRVMYLRWIKAADGFGYGAARLDGTIVLLHVPIDNMAMSLAYVPYRPPKHMLPGERTIWYKKIKHTRAKHGKISTVFELADMCKGIRQPWPMSDCTHLVLDSSLDGFVVREEYLTSQEAEKILGREKFSL